MSFFVYTSRKTDSSLLREIEKKSVQKYLKLKMKLSSLTQLLGLVPMFSKDPLRILEVEPGSYIHAKESEKPSLLRRGIKFLDVSSLPFLGKEIKAKDVPIYSYPEHISQFELTSSLISHINKSSMYDDLVQFSSFYTRYYRSKSGYKSAIWLFDKVYNLTQGLKPGLVSVERFEHSGWDQFSIIVSIKGEKTSDIIILGSHQDSTNLLFPFLLPAPGADDDGSGTVTNLEVLRIYVGLLSKGYRPNNTIEFHFYSAEEGGMLGSLDLFSRYAARKKKVTAMLQQDMTGYVQDPSDEHVGVVTDYTALQLTDFIKLIIHSYLLIPFKESKCGYACSDHSSATKTGYPASFVVESKMSSNNHYLHTTMDTIDRLNFEHMVEHVKIGLGYIIELGNWNFEVRKRA